MRQPASKPSRPPEQAKTLRVLVVDDSAVVRQVMTSVLSREADISVMVASDPLIALDKMQRVRPDVIVLDLELPRMTGLDFLRKLMAEDPLPVVICSGTLGEGTEKSLRALDEGAVEIVPKPRLGVREFLNDSADTLIATVRAAAEARVRRCGLASGPRVWRRVPRRKPDARPAGCPSSVLVAVGASTGGPQALQVLLQSLPADAPGLLIVQHMPEKFTTALARRLNRECEIEVKEAEHGDRVLTGRALIAPGDRHMIVRHAHGEFFASLHGGPRVSRHRPSVDVLFESVAAVAGGAAVGVLLTGMGSDGADALGAMKEAGAVTIAQDQESCVVFGMPAKAISRGVVDEVVSLDRIGSRLLKHCGYEWPRESRSQVMGG